MHGRGSNRPKGSGRAKKASAPRRTKQITPTPAAATTRRRRRALEVKRPTAQNFIELLEATHLIYRLPPFGYGKDVLRARFKIYLADAAIAPAVMLKGKAILEDAAALGVATESAVFKHLFARYYAQNVRFTY